MLQGFHFLDSKVDLNPVVEFPEMETPGLIGLPWRPKTGSPGCKTILLVNPGPAWIAAIPCYGQRNDLRHAAESNTAARASCSPCRQHVMHGPSLHKTDNNVCARCSVGFSATQKREHSKNRVTFCTPQSGRLPSCHVGALRVA